MSSKSLGSEAGGGKASAAVIDDDAFETAMKAAPKQEQIAMDEAGERYKKKVVVQFQNMVLALIKIVD